ncbi:hypothetical protein [Gordonia rhizosphera]|nr:hypothetical protein [Gordonia rhizosphera]
MITGSAGFDINVLLSEADGPSQRTRFRRDGDAWTSEVLPR